MKHFVRVLLALLTPALVGVSCQRDDIRTAEVAATRIRLDLASASLHPGETLRLTVTVEPENATDKSVSWQSTAPAIANVNQEGLVTAFAEGEATIRVRTTDGVLAANCRITVVKETEPTPEPTPTPDPDPSPAPERWTDTGADVPVYPTYNAVSSLADFPRVDIRTDSGQPVQSKTSYEGGTISFKDPKQMYSEVTELKNLKMQIRGRGNTTWEGYWGSKNPYRIKLDEHTKVFGMKGDKDWILLSDRLDPSMMRTAVALRISRLVSMPWTPKFRMAEVYLNGGYAGL